MFEHISGLIAAPYTPMLPDGSIGLDTIPRQAEFLAKSGVRGVFVCGTTGESLSLTVPERKSITERWAECAGDNLLLMVHVGHNSREAAVELAAHAETAGAWGIGAFGPSFFKPSGPEELAEFCSPVAAAAPDLPFYYYHIPSMTGLALPMRTFLDAAAPRIPNLAGIKYTHEDLMDYRLCRHISGGRFDMLFGRDEILLSALALGATGAVGSTYNFAAPLYLRIIEAFNAGDMETARHFQDNAMRMIEIMIRYNGAIVSGKVMMELIGIPCGECRSPLKNLTAEQVDSLAAELDSIGFFGWCS